MLVAARVRATAAQAPGRGAGATLRRGARDAAKP